MKKWNIPKNYSDQRFPNEILQEYADSLIKETEGKLSGQVDESISYDSEGRPKLSYALNVYINALKQSYRLFEVEQISENAYPVNMKIILLSGSEVVPGINSPALLDRKINSYIISKPVGNLMGHFIHISEIKANKG